MMVKQFLIRHPGVGRGPSDSDRFLMDPGLRRGDVNFLAMRLCMNDEFSDYFSK
jgi:hypothetical protein